MIRKGSIKRFAPRAAASVATLGLVGRHVRQQFVGYLALFLALGGVSYAAITLPANSVGSKQIKKRAVKNSDLGRSAVTSGKVKNFSLLSTDFKAGQLPAGATGLQGPKGDKGDQGLPGTNGTNGTNGATNVVTRVASGSGDATVTCNAGEKVTGGGGFAGSTGGVQGFAHRDRPDPGAGTPTGWRYSAQTPGGAAVGVDVYVVCASP